VKKGGCSGDILQIIYNFALVRSDRLALFENLIETTF
jgi:hypothetical protein